MKGIGYYIEIWVLEFTGQLKYRTTGGEEVKEEEMKLVRDLNKCLPVS